MIPGPDRLGPLVCLVRLFSELKVLKVHVELYSLLSVLSTVDSVVECSTLTDYRVQYYY